MPASATITAFNVFAPRTTIRSAQMNANFDTFRGHLIPFDPNTIAAAAVGTYDLGSEDHYWRNAYAQSSVYPEVSTTTSIATPPAGFVKTFAKDGALLVKDDAGDVTEVGAGGGGGIEVEWFTQDNSPVESLFYNSQAYEFEDALSQYLYAEIRLPDSYVAGSPVKLKGVFATNLTAGTAKFKTTSTLIRPGTDRTDSGTNTHTSANAAVNINGTTLVETEFTCDLSDSAGLVNGVALAPGHRLKIKIERDVANDTGAGSVYLFKKGYEVTVQ